MNCKVYEFNKQKAVSKKGKKESRHIDKRKLMIRVVAFGCTALIFGTFCISLLF